MTHQLESELTDGAILPPPNFPLAGHLRPAAFFFWTAALFWKRGWRKSYLFCLAPDQGRSRVVDGGQFRFRVLGEEDGLLAPPQRGRGLSTQGTCWCPSCRGGAKPDKLDFFRPVCTVKLDSDKCSKKKAASHGLIQFHKNPGPPMTLRYLKPRNPTKLKIRLLFLTTPPQIYWEEQTKIIQNKKSGRPSRIPAKIRFAAGSEMLWNTSRQAT